MSNNNLKKRKVVKVQTSKGERLLMMEPCVNMTGPDELICETRCPYGKICKLLPDPRDPEGDFVKENKDGIYGFLNFCGELGQTDEEDADLVNYVPCEGSLEETFKDFKDIYSIVIEHNPSIKIKDVINNICKSWCADYKDNYENCTSNNMTCLLRELFKNDKKLEPKEELENSVEEQQQSEENPTEEAEVKQ